MIAWGLLAFSGQFRKKRLFEILAVSSLLSLLILTRMQIHPWKNGGTLAEHALRLTTNNFMALNMLGRSLEESDRLLEALDYYEHALLINPQYFDARINRVNAWAKAGRRISAVKELESLHKEYPAYARLQSNLGVLLYQQGDKTQGIRHLREAVSKDKSLLDVQFNLSIALYQSGMKEEASTILLGIIQRNPSDFASHLLLGKIFIETKEASKAKKHLAQANKIRPQDQECAELMKQLRNLE